MIKKLNGFFNGDYNFDVTPTKEIKAAVDVSLSTTTISPSRYPWLKAEVSIEGKLTMTFETTKTLIALLKRLGWHFMVKPAIRYAAAAIGAAGAAAMLGVVIFSGGTAAIASASFALIMVAVAVYNIKGQVNNFWKEVAQLEIETDQFKLKLSCPIKS